MTDKEKAYSEIIDFLANANERTLLLRGVADDEKLRILLNALNAQGRTQGLIYLIHTTIEGIDHFFRWAQISNVKLPKKYRQRMKLHNMTLCFDKLSIGSSFRNYDSREFDFMIIWPIQSVTNSTVEIEMLKDMSLRQRTRKIIFPTLHEPSIDPSKMEYFMDRIIRLDCENDNPDEYKRIMTPYE